MSRFDYSDPGLDDDYCDPLSPREVWDDWPRPCARCQKVLVPKPAVPSITAMCRICLDELDAARRQELKDDAYTRALKKASA